MTEQLTYHNTKVQRLRRLLGRRISRHDEGAFVVEGAGLIREAVAAGWEIEAEFLAGGAEPASRAALFELAVGVLERVASTDSPQPNLAVVRIGAAGVDLRTVRFAVVADRLADPGNLGTILRSAEAAGAEVVALTAESVDPFNPKVVRASAGALFHVPVVEATIAEVRAAGLRLLGTSSHEGTPHTDVDWSGRIAIAVGNETHGLAADTPVDEWVRIRHVGRAESLNVAMAATVLCFEAARARA